MKNLFLLVGLFFSVSTLCHAQLGSLPKVTGVTSSSATKTTVNAVIDSTKTPEALLDKAVLANSQGDKAATIEALKAGTAAVETEAKSNTGSLKDKLLGQVSNLKALIPLAESGVLGGGVLQKAAGVAKLLVAHQRIEALLAGASLIPNVGAITNNLGILKSGLSVLSPATQTSGNSLISTALSGLGKLSQDGPAVNALIPSVKGQLGSVLDLVKGGL
jgi:hypothetical protein